MQLIERAANYEFLGREFLVWLWFRSDTREGRFFLSAEEAVELWFDGRIVLQKDSESEKVICLGESSHPKEARFALAEYKTITEAMLRLVIGEDEWTFILDSAWLNFRSFKTPRVVQDADKDAEGLFYEKLHLIEKALGAMESIYASFIKLRLSPEWKKKELPALLQWIKEGK
jgi:hypothetical protein